MTDVTMTGPRLGIPGDCHIVVSRYYRLASLGVCCIDARDGYCSIVAIRDCWIALPGGVCPRVSPSPHSFCRSPEEASTAPSMSITF